MSPKHSLISVVINTSSKNHKPQQQDIRMVFHDARSGMV